MQKRQLGQQGLEVSAIGLGCMGMTGLLGIPGVYGPADEAEAIATIHRALDLGVNFFDTAEVYGPFANEELVGRALKGRRDKAIIATKFGNEITAEGAIIGLNSRPENAHKVADASLKRLGVDHIDLFYQHRVDPNTPIEDTVGAMAELVAAGKVRYLGLSEASPSTVRRAHAVHAITALQTEYSLWERGPENEILPTVRELGIGFVAYSPLGRGFLTGEIKRAEDYPEGGDYRAHDPRLQGENYDQNLKRLEEVKALATEKGVTPGQIALAWLLHQGDDIVPIPGTKRRKYLEENATAVDVALSAKDLKRLDAAVPQGSTSGQRYAEAYMAAIDR